METIKNYLFYVHNDVNYDVIFVAQLFGLLVCIILYALQEYYSSTFDGWFVIFLPFLPGAIRQYVIRERWKYKKEESIKNGIETIKKKKNQ